MGFELATLVVIGTDCIDSHKSNYRMATTTGHSIVTGESNVVNKFKGVHGCT
jgi:hypothetical protein